VSAPVFGHGKLRLYLLALLDEREQHGYDLMQALSDRFGGTYVPSAGTIYPRLARLEEEGLVTHDEVNGRKVYRITDAGRQELHDREDELAEFTAAHVLHLPQASVSRRSMATARPVLLERITGDFFQANFASPRARQLFCDLGGTSALILPMVARRRTLGAVAMVRTAEARRFAPGDVDLAEDLARRAALALDNVRLYQQEHTVADTLQRSLLPELPDIAGIEAAVARMAPEPWTGSSAALYFIFSTAGARGASSTAATWRCDT